MSKILLGPIISEIRGKTGAVVFSRNRFGNIIRRKTSPVQPNSVLQNAQRSFFSFLSTHFKESSTSTERQAWSDWGANSPISNTLGQVYHPTGINSFLRPNTLLKLTGGSLQANPPAMFGQARSLILIPAGFVISEAAQTISISASADVNGWAPNLPGDELIIFMGAPQNPSVSFFKSPYRYAGHMQGNVVPLIFPQTVPCPFYAQEDQKVWIAVTHMDPTGLVSPRAFATITVVA